MKNLKWKLQSGQADVAVLLRSAPSLRQGLQEEGRVNAELRRVPGCGECLRLENGQTVPIPMNRDAAIKRRDGTSRPTWLAELALQDYSLLLNK